MCNLPHISQICLVQGRPLLVENVEEDLDPILDSVLYHTATTVGPNVVMIGDKEVGGHIMDNGGPRNYLHAPTSIKATMFDIAG